MRILLVGGGGREDVLAWKLSRDRRRPSIVCAPGNAGTRRFAESLDVAAEDVPGLLAWAVQHKPDLTIVGPEAPLCAGIVDRFRDAGLRIFGPDRAAAELEGSKVFAKEVMQAAGVPTAEAHPFTDPVAAKAHVRKTGAPVVIKAEGLAAGKGVTVCDSVAQAEAAIDAALVRGAFGAAGRRVLVEEFMAGEEASILALVDGATFVPLASAQDHKRVFDNDQGPNTGGMGAYSPAPVVGDAAWPVIRTRIFEPLLKELLRRGIHYKGVLYAGLMMTARGPRVVEFNCRFGDPEAQVILPRLACDLLPALDAVIDGTLNERLVAWHNDACVCVVMASRGYPGAYPKGIPVRGIEKAEEIEGVTVFHAGTAVRDGAVVTSGGRVLNVTARGASLELAVEKVYAAVERIEFDGAHYRRDIASRALQPAGKGSAFEKAKG